MSVIQQVYLPDAKYSIYIKGIKPDKDNPLSGFVKTKKAGERILAMVHEVLGTTECKTFLDYRPSEPTWIQFKFQKEEFDLDMLDALSRKNGGVITKEIIEKCKL